MSARTEEVLYLTAIGRAAYIVTESMVEQCADTPLGPVSFAEIEDSVLELLEAMVGGPLRIPPALNQGNYREDVRAFLMAAVLDGWMREYPDCKAQVMAALTLAIGDPEMSEAYH